MRDKYRELVEQIRDEILHLEHSFQRVLKEWQYAIADQDKQDSHIDSAALNLQSFYTGIERLFRLIAKNIDRSLPSGESWHSDLLKQMATDLADIRPAVIKGNSITILDELLGFRHRVRNIYAFELIPENVGKLVLTLNDFWPELRAELLAFAEFLAELYTQDNTN
jgi:hypothetical protein